MQRQSLFPARQDVVLDDESLFCDLTDLSIFFVSAADFEHGVSHAKIAGLLAVENLLTGVLQRAEEEQFAHSTPIHILVRRVGGDVPSDLFLMEMAVDNERP